MEKAQEILFHIDELYAQNPSKEKILRQSQENLVRYQAWVDAFKEYDLGDVLAAVDNFWEFKSSKSKPNVAQIKAVLSVHNTEKIKEQTTLAQAVKGDFAVERMNSDIDAGSCRNNLYVYREAERIVLNDWLTKEIPVSVWAKMNYAGRVQQAIDKGLFNNFDEALRQAAFNRFGREAEFLSANEMERQYSNTNNTGVACKSLASHWRI